MRQKDYYLGLDMGTSSVGWAVTDKEYNILRVKGKDFWGVREFDRANTSAERRSKRGSRRRIQREAVRQGLLRSYFAEEIEKVDPLFFVRLDNSRYYTEDKNALLQSNQSIFDDANYTDKDYYHDYPTIFHLRKELIENQKAPYDVRFVYLAISNMFKHRGHFLLNSEEENISEDEIKYSYEQLVEVLADIDIFFLVDQFEELINVLCDKAISRTKKSESILELFHIKKSDKKTSMFIKCLCGLKVQANDLFDLETEETVNICFNDYAYADSIPMIETAIGEYNYELIETMKKIYDYAQLKEYMDGYLSVKRVELYDKHKEDLRILKCIYRKYKTKEEYNEMFRSEKNGTYSAYVDSLNSDDSLAIEKKYRRNMKGRKQEDIYAKIKKDISEFSNDSNVEYVLSEIDKETFLPKQLTGANGIIPNQIHKKELVKILKNAESYLPFLKEKDESGLTKSERIIRLFSFQIPYYVGPVSKNSKNHWVVRKETGQILPWNMNEKIDMESTNKEFINRLIRSCTYLKNEKVLPKASLLYEAYSVLNEINVIKINGIRISVELKQRIYLEMFQKGKRVTRKQLERFLIVQGAMQTGDKLEGIDKELNNSLSSYGKMYAVFGEKLNEDSYKEIAEQIIRYRTIYDKSSDMFSRKLAEYVSKGILSENDKKRILGYRFKDWGKLSKELLELNGFDKNAGQASSLIRAMWENNLNLNELLNSEQFTFKEVLAEKCIATEKILSEFEYEDLEEYYFSAPVKRMIWQTILLIREIEEIMGSSPKKVFIEMTRSDEEKGDKGRKDSRAKQLLELYKNIKNTEIHNWKQEINDAEQTGMLRSRKLFLYYLQMGRDAYTGNEIDLSELFTNRYDIDHIYPQHYVKDDSLLNNLVLVDKRYNEEVKKDIYPLPRVIIDNPKVRELWDTLHEGNMMNDEKYHRLIERSGFTDEQLAGFIARQLVETAQGTKGIADILKQLLSDTRIIYSKANNVSDFRNNFNLGKSRVANEFHHANDAYLNIVVGNVYDTKFTQNPYNFISKEYNLDKKKNHYHLNRMFKWDVERNGETAWIADKKNQQGTICTVKTMLNKNTPIVTRISYVNKGVLFNEQPKGKYEAKKGNYHSLKEGMEVNKYGGYGSINPAYFTFIEYDDKKKRKKSFESVNMIVANRIKNKDDLKRYYEEELGYKNVRVICELIKKDTLIKYNGFFMYLTGLDNRKNVEFRNAVNLCANNQMISYIQKLENSKKRGYILEKIDKEKNLELYDLILDKHTNGIYKNSPKPLGDILNAGREKFVLLDLDKQVELLYKLLQVTSISKVSVGLDEIGGPKSDVGRIRFSGNMTNAKELKIIYQSVTGLYEKEIDLLKL